MAEAKSAYHSSFDRPVTCPGKHVANVRNNGAPSRTQALDTPGEMG